jgi:glycogen operon protein
MRNFLATLLFSQGVPMLLGGDEMGRTQQGNNNAYCQDNEISWVNWNLDEGQKRQLEFARRMIALRKRHPAFRRARFLTGNPLEDGAPPDISWLSPTGELMQEDDWKVGHAKALGMHLAESREVGFLLLFNAHFEDVPFTLPPEFYGRQWRMLVDTAQPENPEMQFGAADIYPLQSRSFVLLQSGKD